MNVHGHGVELLEGGDSLQKYDHGSAPLYGLCTHFQMEIDASVNCDRATAKSSTAPPLRVKKLARSHQMDIFRPLKN
jgi:hypothetical protein